MTSAEVFPYIKRMTSTFPLAHKGATVLNFFGSHKEGCELWAGPRNLIHHLPCVSEGAHFTVARPRRAVRGRWRLYSQTS
jgi:hypothetical protein